MKMTICIICPNERVDGFCDDPDCSWCSEAGADHAEIIILGPSEELDDGIENITKSDPLYEE
jgi:hypothetical protein